MKLISTEKNQVRIGCLATHYIYSSENLQDEQATDSRSTCQKSASLESLQTVFHSSKIILITVAAVDPELLILLYKCWK